MISKPVFNRAPLPSNSMASLPLTAIKPEGWLREELELAAEGLTGKLYTFWSDVSDQSGWLGGEGDGWERTPYYLDGLLPLAYLLDDDKLKERAHRYIEWTLNSQRENGWFGPQDNDDWWPRMVMLKVLKQYYTATMDKRVLTFMGSYFKYQYENIDQRPLKEWAVARAAENMEVALWLYNITGAKFLIALCKKLNAQALDWTAHFHTFAHTRPMDKLTPWNEMKEKTELVGEERPYLATQYYLSHVVNIAMGLKAPAVTHLFKSGHKESEGFRVGYEKLMKYHGMPNGIFSGDEHLSGTSPTQGTELCAVAELMHTIELMLGIGDFGNDLGDILERLAFNALPATLNREITAHQYLQQVNQVKVSEDKRNWYNNNDDANIYGLEPHFGCCTANMHQAWPKYVASLWYATCDDGLAVVSYAPSSVRYAIKNVPVRINVDTVYPFEEDVRINVSAKQPIAFPIKLRIPKWANGATLTLPGGEMVTPQAGEYFVVDRVWQTGDILLLHLPMEPVESRWHHQSIAFHVGPLLMAFRPEEHWEKIVDRGVFSDWAVSAGSAWNWAVYPDSIAKVIRAPELAGPFGYGVAVKLLVKAAKVPSWQMDGASCASPPINPEIDPDTVGEIELVPYGDTGLRIAEFPVISQK